MFRAEPPLKLRFCEVIIKFFVEGKKHFLGKVSLKTLLCVNTSILSNRRTNVLKAPISQAAHSAEIKQLPGAKEQRQGSFEILSEPRQMYS